MPADPLARAYKHLQGKHDQRLHGHRGVPVVSAGSYKLPSKGVVTDPESHWYEKMNPHVVQEWGDHAMAHGWSQEQIDDFFKTQNERWVFPTGTDLNYPPDWCEKPGTHIAYRVGRMDSPRNVFFGPDANELDAYVPHHGEGAKVKAYEVSLKTPLVVESKDYFYPGFYEMIRRKADNFYDKMEKFGGQGAWERSGQEFHDNDYWEQHYDSLIRKKVAKMGHDALIIRYPAMPASRELMVVDPTKTPIKELES